MKRVKSADEKDEAIRHLMGFKIALMRRLELAIEARDYWRAKAKRLEAELGGFPRTTGGEGGIRTHVTTKS